MTYALHLPEPFLRDLERGAFHDDASDPICTWRTTAGDWVAAGAVEDIDIFEGTAVVVHVRCTATGGLEFRKRPVFRPWRYALVVLPAARAS